jgi:hypothetical protein
MVEVRISSVEIRPNKGAKEAHMAKMEEVGKLILADPPSWLSDVLSRFSFDFYSAHNTEAMWPTRTEMRDSLAEAGVSAIELSNLLRNSAMVAFLTSNSDADPETIDALSPLLSKFAAWAHQARNAPQLVGSNKKLLPGRGKPLLPGTMPGKYVCAAIIAEVLAFFEGKDPAPSNRRARKAADKFWQSWGPSEGWGNDPLTGWKRYFENVRDPKLELLRSEVRRHLKIYTHLAALGLEK